jgi:hypothetical protein
MEGDRRNDGMGEPLAGTVRTMMVGPANGERRSDTALAAGQLEPVTDEDHDWLESDLSQLSAYEPYDWGETDPAAGLPIVYLRQGGFIVEGKA